MNDFFLQKGFLETRAPLFMDITTLIVSLLPFLVAIAIYFAKRGNIKLHSQVQLLIFIVSIIVVIFFEIGVRIVGGYKNFLEGGNVNHNYILLVLIFHIVIATITLLLWSYLVIKSFYDYNKSLPGSKSAIHKKIGFILYALITLTALTGIWVYLIIFVY